MRDCSIRIFCCLSSRSYCLHCIKRPSQSFLSLHCVTDCQIMSLHTFLWYSNNYSTWCFPLPQKFSNMMHGPQQQYYNIEIEIIAKTSEKRNPFSYITWWCTMPIATDGSPFGVLMSKLCNLVCVCRHTDCGCIICMMLAHNVAWRCIGCWLQAY